MRHVLGNGGHDNIFLLQQLTDPLRTMSAEVVPIEISRIMFFAIEHGCSMEAIVEETKAYESPITQGGLEIKTMVTCTWSDEGIRILQDTIAQRYCFETRLTDDFDSILREIERVLVLEDSEDELVEQFDDLVTIDIIDDENDNN